MTWLGTASPEWDFDSLCYAGCAYHWLGYSDGDVHRRVYADLRGVVSGKALDDLLQGSEYRRTIAADPASLAAQFPFYSNKPIYTLITIAVVAMHEDISDLKAAVGSQPRR